MGELDRELVERGLSRTASTADRVAALLEVGFSKDFLGVVCGVTPWAVSNWLNDGAKPRREARYRIDAVRGALGKLVLQQGLEPDEAFNWMRSIPEDPPYVRPIDMIGTPEGVVELMSMIDASFQAQ